MNEYEEDFNKIYFFKIQDELSLPRQVFESPKWCIPELQSKKTELNIIKGRLGKYKLKVWSKHTAHRDRAGFVMKKLAEKIKPELLTQAWCKFYEILAHFPVIPLCAVSNKKLESLHLCEAPGAFVCALNHYLTLNYPGLEWAWKANTLNPNYEGNELNEMIPDDRFIRHTLKNWIFGADFSGDITKTYNHEYLVNYVQHTKVSLITADGSVDCMSDPGEQERHVERLHFCETITALRVLQTGGTYVLKIFTMFEESTLNLLFLLNCSFDKVALFKPCTSKSGNSEVYVICTKYKGFSIIDHLWRGLWGAYEDIDIFNSNSMFLLTHLPDSFLAEIYKCSDFFMKKQADTILDNIYHFDRRIQDNIFITKSFVAQVYLARHEIKPIPESSKIVPNICVSELWRVHSTKNSRHFFNTNLPNVIRNRKIYNSLDIIIGKEIQTVYNSKFTDNDNLRKIQTMCANNKNTSDFYQYVLKVLQKNNIVINVKEFDVTIFSKFQKELFLKISSVIGVDKNLILINIPFVTHFLAGLLYLLIFFYDKVYMGRGVVYLYQPKSSVFKSIQSIFNSITEKYKLTTESNSQFAQDIVHIVSPSVFETESFIETIWNYNKYLFCEDKCFTSPYTYHLQ
ncbi:cap-specific mRNA (nucleoside-2'-O-)-methyltransferase 2-like [Diabrotica undecimpunctata]|uniref:cap-specific mRNA (nucleoside-2'-O-)-methyltransferase 2-like n=1 Tax=Diabrotica undecimpunctata TaxID=50387 RepID=UPI003B642119